MQSASFFNNIKFYSSLATDHNSPANISNIIESVHSRNKKRTISVHTETSEILIIDVSLSLTRPLTIFSILHISMKMWLTHISRRRRQRRLGLEMKECLIGSLIERERAGEFANYNKLLYDGHMKSINADVVVKHTKTEFLINDDGELTF